MTPAEKQVRVAGMDSRKWKYVYATDYTNYEKHFTPLVMRSIEFPMYERLLTPALATDDMKFLFSILTGKNKLRTRSGQKATVVGRRMSGEMNTSLGNSWANFILCAFVMAQKGLDLDDFDGIFEGDDGLICSNVELTSADFRACGFDIKIERVRKPSEASFCGLIFADSGQTVRDPVRFFQKFGWVNTQIHSGQRVLDALMRAKALSALYETPACPIVSAAAWNVLHTTRHVDPRFVRDGYHDSYDIPRNESAVPKPSITSDTRHLFERMFGIDVSMQIELEAEFMRGDFSRMDSMLQQSSAITATRANGYMSVCRYSSIYVASG